MDFADPWNCGPKLWDESDRDESDAAGWFLFYPADEEIILSNMALELDHRSFTPGVSSDVDLNNCEPWDLPAMVEMGDTGRPWYWKYWKATGKDKDILVRKTRIQGQPQDESDRDELGENTELIEFVLKRRSEHLKLLTGSSWSSWVIMYIITCLMNWLLLRKSCIDAISRVVKISAITAIKGGTDKKIGSQATPVLKYFSNPDSSGTEKSIKAVGAKTTATWVIAIAAPHHATGNSDLLSGFITKHDDMFVHAVDGVPMQVDACGAVVTDAMTLPDVWVVPGLTANVVSVSQLAELDYSVRFGGGACYIRSATDGTVVGKAHLVEGGLYVLDFLKIPLAL